MTATATRALPEHGTTARYWRGCHKTCCRQAHNTERRRQRRLAAYGRWNQWTDGQTIRDHLADLKAHGIGLETAANLAGLQYGTVSAWVYGRAGSPPTARIRTAVAEKILAVRPVLDNIADGARIDDIGTMRRLQALVAIGWPGKELAARLGANVSDTPRLFSRRRVTGATARAVRVLFAELWDADPVKSGIPAHVALRARLRAQRQGWAPPAAWDAIDDPDATPSGHVPVRRSSAELVADAEELLRLGVPLEDVAARHGVTVHALKRARERVAARERAAASAAPAT